MALACLSVPAFVAVLAWRRKGGEPLIIGRLFLALLICSGLFLLLEVAASWDGVRELAGWAQLVIALLSIVIAVAIMRQTLAALKRPSTADLQKANLELAAVNAAHEHTYEELRAARSALEEKVEIQAAALLKNDRLFRRYQEISPAGFMILKSVRDHDGQIADFEWSFANASARRMLRQDMIEGRRMLFVLPAVADNGLFDMFRRVVELDETITRDIHYKDHTVDAWYSINVVKVEDGFAAAFDDITEKQERESQIRLLMREVNHRSKNLLAIVQSIAYQTAQRGNPASFVEDLTDRLQGLSGSQDLMIEGRWQGVEIADLIRTQLSHLGRAPEERVSFCGPKVIVTPAAAQGIGMALHELSTNAMKYGALKNETGHIHIEWRTEGKQFRLTWREEGGPTVEKPSRTGFGRMVFEQMTGHALQGAVDISYEPEGLKWTLTAPLRNVVASKPDEGLKNVI